MEASLGDRIAECVLNQFQKLPTSRKPILKSNGIHEWVPCSGVVAEIRGEFKCICLGTGMKCLPASKLPKASGNALHDWHAEIVTIRALNLHLLSECQRLQQGVAESEVIERSNNETYPFQIKSGVIFHMYCSEAPCGDASMELVMAAQDDSTPWNENSSSTDLSNSTNLSGRRGFANLGIVRRKPARSDAPISLSKSCSDKIALRQCTSFLSWATSLFILPERAYFKSLVLPQAQFSESGLNRCFSPTGRLSPLRDVNWPEGYAFHELQFHATSLEFPYSRRTLEAKSYKISPCNLSVAWTVSGFEERTLGGFVLGKKPFDIKAASALSRRRIWERAINLLNAATPNHQDIGALLSAKTYLEAKSNELLSSRKAVQTLVKDHCLRGWIRNEGDDKFSSQ